jgi:hypothetical protein
LKNVAPLLVSLFLAVALCGCGQFQPSSSTSLEQARKAYQKSIEDVADSTGVIRDNTRESADSLKAIADKLDVVIENTSPRRRASGLSPLDMTPAEAAPVELASAPPQSPAPPEPVGPPKVETSSTPEVIPVATPAPATDSPPVTSAPSDVDRILDRLEEIVNRAPAPSQSAPQSLAALGNDVTLPDGTLVSCKGYIADHSTGGYRFEGDVLSRLVELGFQQHELECLTAAECHKLYDAWHSSHPPLAIGYPPKATSPPAPQVRYQSTNCPGGVCPTRPRKR